MPSDQLRDEVAAVFGEIMAAKRLVRSGRTVELEGLDRRIGELCMVLAGIPREDGQALLPLLEDVRVSLDDLALALRTASSTDRAASIP
jgi:hypothetical protein